MSNQSFSDFYKEFYDFDKDKVNTWSYKNELESHEVPLTAIIKCYNEECGSDVELTIYSSNTWCDRCIYYL